MLLVNKDIRNGALPCFLQQIILNGSSILYLIKPDYRSLIRQRHNCIRKVENSLEYLHVNRGKLLRKQSLRPPAMRTVTLRKEGYFVIANGGLAVTTVIS